MFGIRSQDVAPVVRGLYDDQPHECKSDGRRFKAKEDLQRHLDKLFAINKSRKDCTGVKERQWFRKVEDWVMCVDVIERPTAPVVADAKNSNRMEIEVPKSDVKAEAEENDAERVPAEDFEHGVRYCMWRWTNVLFSRTWPISHPPRPPLLPSVSSPVSKRRLITKQRPQWVAVSIS